ncbi:hypothetical protein QE416_000240 [Microbacterium sp. SORGH_AS 421]|nr:hypothetical protein [Microbacterium sp. SORGH_AS_0421]
MGFSLGAGLVAAGLVMGNATARYLAVVGSSSP